MADEIKAKWADLGIGADTAETPPHPRYGAVGGMWELVLRRADGSEKSLGLQTCCEGIWVDRHKLGSARPTGMIPQMVYRGDGTDMDLGTGAVLVRRTLSQPRYAV